MATFPLFQVAFWSQTQKKCCPVAVADSSSLRTSHAAMPTNRPRISVSKLPRLADQPKGFLVPAASSHASDKGIISPDHQKISRKWSFKVLNSKVYSISSICFQELYMPSWGNIFSWLIPLKGETLNTSPLKPWKPYGLKKQVVSWEPHQQRDLTVETLKPLRVSTCALPSSVSNVRMMRDEVSKYSVSPQITVLEQDKRLVGWRSLMSLSFDPRDGGFPGGRHGWCYAWSWGWGW